MIQVWDRSALVSQLVAEEGTRLKPYPDARGKITIGVGRNLTDVGITTGEARLLLDHDIDSVLADLAAFPWSVSLDLARHVAIADLRFNLGPEGFRTFHRLIAAMSAGQYAAAAAELVGTPWSTEVQPSRRDRLIRQLATGNL